MDQVAAGRRPESRDEKVWRLRHVSRWSLRQIGREVAMSPEGVSRLLERLERAATSALDAEEASLLVERQDLRRRLAWKQARERAIDRRLREIAEERQSRAIDQLNGL